MSARNKTVSTGFPFEGAKFSSRIPRFPRRYTMEGEWKKPSESALVSFGAKKLDGAGMDGIKKERKKERKGKRAMKPRRKNGINSLSFFSVRNAASNKKEISNNNGKKYSIFRFILFLKIFYFFDYAKISIIALRVHKCFNIILKEVTQLNSKIQTSFRKMEDKGGRRFKGRID